MLEQNCISNHLNTHSLDYRAPGPVPLGYPALLLISGVLLDSESEERGMHFTVIDNTVKDKFNIMLATKIINILNASVVQCR